MPNVEPTLYKEWGKTAAENYLTSGGSLNLEIAKIASEEDLNPTQIKRLCEAANMSTYQSLFAVNKDKSLDFDLADPEKVAVSLNEVDPPKAILDYAVPPTFKKTASSDKYNKLFGFDSVSNESEVDENIKVANHFGGQVKAAQDEIRQRRMMNHLEKISCEERVYNMMKQMVLRGQDFSKIASIAIETCSADIKGLMAEFYDKMNNEGAFGVMAKHAQETGDDIISQVMKTDQGYVKKDGSVEIINNNHPLVQEVNTLGDAIISEDKLKNATWLLNDTANTVKGKIENLSGSKQRDQSIKNTLKESKADQATEFFRPEDNRVPGQLTA